MGGETVDPSDSVPVPKLVPSAKNCTCPVGTPGPGAAGATVAGKVTGWPNTDGLTVQGIGAGRVAGRHLVDRGQEMAADAEVEGSRGGGAGRKRHGRERLAVEEEGDVAGHRVASGRDGDDRGGEGHRLAEDRG